MGRPWVDIVSQIGIEVTSGVPVAANRFLPTFSFNPKLKRETKQFRAQGNKYTTSSVRHRQFSDGSFDGVLDYNSFIYVLNGLLPPVTTPAAITGSTTAKKWAFRPIARGLDNPKTFTIEKGDSTAAEQYAYCQLTSMTAALGQDDMKITGNLFARTLVPGISLTPTPTAIPERPVERGQVNVYVDNAYANIGTTQITDPFEEEIALGEKFKPKFVHNRTYQSFKDGVEVAPSLVFSFMQEHNSQSRAMLADAIANDTIHYMRWEAKGIDLSTLQDGSVTELVQFDLAGKFTECEEIPDALGGGVYAYRYHFVALDDPNGMGRPWQADIVNTITTL
jgi:hypothetical protein